VQRLTSVIPATEEEKTWRIALRPAHASFPYVYVSITFSFLLLFVAFLKGNVLSLDFEVN
jgi:hypothetical protein